MNLVMSLIIKKKVLTFEYIDFILKKEDEKYHLKLSKEYFFKLIEDFSMVKFNVDLKKWNFKNLKYNDNSIKEILKISNIDDF